MSQCACGSGMRWHARADAMVDVFGKHVLDVAVDERGRLVLTVESGQVEAGCPLPAVCSTLGHRGH